MPKHHPGNFLSGRNIEIPKELTYNTNLVPLSRANRCDKAGRPGMVTKMARENLGSENQVVNEAQRLRELKRRLKKLKKKKKLGDELEAMIEKEGNSALDKVNIEHLRLLEEFKHKII